MVKKDSKAEIRSARGSYEYHYAGLGAVLDSIRGTLAAHGLAYTQPIEEIAEGTYLVTVLMHTSGQWIASRFKIPTANLIGPQAIGSYIAYARRYSIASLTGVAIEDDDGRAAQRQAGPPQGERPGAKPAQQEPGEPYADYVNRSQVNPPAREPGCDDTPPASPPSGPAPNGSEPRRRVGKRRDGPWLVQAAAKQNLLDEFTNIGLALGYAAPMNRWTEEQVAKAIEYRKELLAR